MCYDSEARPPDAPHTPGSASGEDIQLQAKDGSSIAAYVARSGAPGAAQVLIYPDIRGLHQFYKELALRFAEQGIDALAIDFYSRTAGDIPRDDNFEWQPHLEQLTAPVFFDDVEVALATLRQGDGATKATFTLGFCMGGTLSVLSGAEDFGLAGLIAFYSGITRRFVGSKGTLLEVAPLVKLPVLGLFGGADQGIPASALQTLDEELDKAGVEHEIVIYEGAPHSYFDRRQADFAEASTDSWRRVLEFIAAHSE